MSGTTKSQNSELNGAPLPCSEGWPWLGDIPALLLHRRDHIDELHKRWGDAFAIRVAGTRMVLLHHPEHAQQVLRQNAANYVKQGAIWDRVRDLFGNGLLTSEGEAWQESRIKLNPQFSRRQVEHLLSRMTETIERQLQAWPTGTPFDVSGAVSKVTMEVICQTMFGGALADEEAAAIAADMSFILDHMMHRLLTEAVPNWFPVPGRRAFRQATARIDRILAALVEGRRETGANNMLATLLAGGRESPSRNAEVRDQIVTMFVAGYETTAVAVTWALVRIAQDPDLHAQLCASVDRALGDQRPSVEALREPMLENTFHEALRLDPPIYFLPRAALANDIVGGYRIAEGDVVVLMIDRINRHPAFWRDPNSFKPVRFSDTKSRNHPCAMIPFGFGKRLCIGSRFAILEGTALLALILQRYNFALERNVKPRLAMTRRPDGPVTMTLTPRPGFHVP